MSGLNQKFAFILYIKLIMYGTNLKIRSTYEDNNLPFTIDYDNEIN